MITLIREISLSEFDAWGGAERTLGRLSDAGMVEAFEVVIEELYPEGIDETHLNDLLRFEADWVYAVVGLRSELDVEQELREAKDELIDLLNNIEEDGEDEESQAMKLELEERISELTKELWSF